MQNKDEVIQIFNETGALLTGHFILRSGLRSPNYLQFAKVGEHMDKVTRLAELLLEKLKDFEYDTIVAPAMGGLVIGQEVARQAKKRYIFLEKVEGKLELRRGFKFKPGEKVLLIEDVITRGGRAQESLDILRENGADPVAIGVVIDRSAGKAKFDIPHVSLVELTFDTYEVDSLPESLEAIPAIKPGS